MILKQFSDNYDAEFVNLMLDIQNLMENFCKSDKLKINSWAKILCIPTMNVEFKKNRNLYAIKLLDNVVNGKLEEPFTKFVKDKELKKLNPILVKTQLTSTFLNLIKKYENNENYLNNQIYEEDNYNTYINKEAKNSTKSNYNNCYKKIQKDNNLRNKTLYLDYDNQFLLVPMANKRSKSSTKFHTGKNKNGNNKICFDNNNNYDVNCNFSYEDDLRPSDILLLKNFGNLPYKNKSNVKNFKNTIKYNKYEKLKLKSLVDNLNEQRIKNNSIILNQAKEIDKMKQKICLLQKRIKRIYDLQK